MKLGTRSRIAVTTAVLAAGPLLGPAVPAGATYEPCVPDHCDTVVRYFSDATYSRLVGEYAGEVCGTVEWGEHTQYAKRYIRTC